MRWEPKPKKQHNSNIITNGLSDEKLNYEIYALVQARHIIDGYDVDRTYLMAILDAPALSDAGFNIIGYVRISR